MLAGAGGRHRTVLAGLEEPSPRLEGNPQNDVFAPYSGILISETGSWDSNRNRYGNLLRWKDLRRERKVLRDAGKDAQETGCVEGVVLESWSDQPRAVLGQA